ncbi:alpha/beta fold hydrolase [Massilia sp. CMS3.1]|uniref:alpha/beta fold hydrolase n=1 Tax=Massilia sp. CMS3.1 TaxID=3373083 RepID=UPI003EE6944A
MRPVLLPIKLTRQVAGATVEYILAGSGAPAVVLVNGAGGPVEGWFKVFARLASSRCTVAWNRPGIDQSSKPAVPQTALEVVESLRELLDALAVPPPYVLVGHSLGGLVVNLFARLYPEEVAAVVMLEATAPEDVRVLPRFENGVQRWLKRVTRRLLPPHPFDETEQLDASLAELDAAPPFPVIPLLVVTGARPALPWATPRALLDARARHQQAVVRLSPLGRQVMALKSGHFPQFSEPELVCAKIEDAVREGMARLRHI